MDDGWAQIFRQYKCWRHYKKPSVRMVFEDLLMSADWQGDTGIAVTSSAEIQRSTGLSKPTVSRALDVLCESGELTRGTINGTKAFRIELSKVLSDGKIILPQGQKFLPDGQIFLPFGQKFLPLERKKQPQKTKEKESFPPHPLYKEKEKENIAHATTTHAHARERLIAEANVDLRIEQGCKSLGIDPATYQELLDAVINDWEFTNVPDEEWTMFHLLQTMRIKNNIKKRENNGQAQNGNNRQPVAAGRADRAAAVAATMAALGAAGTQTESLPY